MRRFLLIGLVGSSLAGVLATWLGTWPRLQAQQVQAVVASNVVSGAFGGRNPQDEVPQVVKIAAPKTTLAEAKIREKLREKINLEFRNSTTLEDLMKYIQSKTIEKTDFPEGIPVYLNPVGLQDADKTPQSTISIELKGIPLATTLQLALDQLGLAYWIHPDGLLIVTNKESEDIPVDASHLILDELTALRQEVRLLREEVRISRNVGDHPRPAPATPVAPGVMKDNGFR